jgi:hypothetical protein
MEQFFINFYTDEDGNKVRGLWKQSEAETDAEKNSHLYKNQLGLRWRETAVIDKAKVVALGKEHNMTIAEVLQCV